MEIHEDGTPILRYSLYEAWWASPNTAMERYFPKEVPRLTNRFMEFGSKVANALEERPVPDWVADVPCYKINEHRIITNIEGFWVRGTIDSFCPHELKFLDNKAAFVKPLKKGGYGAHSWTEDKVKKHKQLDFYSTLIQYEYSWVDDTAHISVVPYFEDKWETMRRVPGLNLYDPKYFIPRIITQKERNEMMEKIITTSKDIIRNYEMWCKLHENK